jgi:hypothetical protein
VGESAGSAVGSGSVPAASHSGGPRAGAIRGGAVGSPRWARMSRIVAASVMKVMMLVAPPEVGHTSRSLSRDKSTNHEANHVAMNYGVERQLPRR